ncbi:KDGP aldolase family protein [Clostridium sp.]|uniref:2-dehydro-3-deoxy-phosphogluconate aldolase n=1 Tax=Clostridium sp. TaxID=1506 RepID=UPI001D8104D9|nr:KDGP aldolase family protein [Clostridium sp.]MBS5938466.1 KDGP aldolase family protein [Clostridium sp.]
MSLKANFYKDKICLNVLVNSIENAREVYKAAEGHVLAGLLSKNYNTVEEAVEDMKIYSKEINNSISVGLGAGDPNQWKMVAEISKEVQPQHVNQVFTGIGYTRGLLGQSETLVNGLISPSGKVGFVKVSTGPLSSKAEDGIIPVRTAIQMLKDMGCSSVKFFPMGGLKIKDEYREVCKACAELDFIMEPTGGIDLSNFEEIVKIALEEGVKKVVPHVYTSIVDKETGDTKVEDIKKLLSIVKKLV